MLLITEKTNRTHEFTVIKLHKLADLQERLLAKKITLEDYNKQKEEVYKLNWFKKLVMRIK